MLRDPETLLREVSWLRRLARSLVADASTADDLAGDALVAWSASAGSVREPRPWLATVLRHGSARAHRRALLRQQGERAAARPEALPAVDAAIARTELHQAVVNAVLALHEPYRSAIVLRFLDDLALGAVAQRLQVPVATARTRIRRGLELLRQRLDHRYGERRAWTALLLPFTGPSLLGVFMATKSLLAAAGVAAALLLYLLLPEADAPGGATPRSVAAGGAPLVAANQTPEAGTQRIAADAAPEGAVRAPTAVVQGRAVDEATLQPIEGVTVSWLRLDADIAPQPESVTTGADGRFALTTNVAAPAEHLALLLRHPGHAMTPGMLGSDPAGPLPAVFDTGDVLMPPGTEVTGVVRDSEGRGAAGVSLFVCVFSYWTDQGRIVQLPQALPVGRTDGDGGFRLEERLLPNRPPSLLIAAGPAGVGFTELDQLQRESFRVTADVQLMPPVQVAVRVVDEQGVALAGALVVAEPRTLPLGMPGTFPVYVESVARLADSFSARSSGDGRVLLRPLCVRPGEQAPFTLRVQAEGRDTNVVKVTLPCVDEVQVVLPKSRRLEVKGTVRDSAGRPIAGARVQARWQENVAAETSADGTYGLRLPRGTGPLRVGARAKNCFTAWRELQPDAALSAIAFDFVLSPAATLSGRLMDQHGNAVARADVWVQGGDGQSTPTGDDGTFTMELPPAAAATLHVQPPQPSSAWAGGVDHVIVPGQTMVTLVLQRLPAARADLEVTLADAMGKPLEARQVILVRQGDSDALWHPASAVIGHVTASDLPPGEWSLDVEPVSGCRLAVQFTVTSGEAVRLQLVQPLAGNVRGEVQFGEAPPMALELAFGEGAQQARFVAAAGQEVLGKGSGLRLHPESGFAFTIADVDPSRPLVVVARAGELGAEAQVRVPAGGEGALRIRLAPLATLVLGSASPFECDRLLLQLRQGGGAWGEPMRFEGLAGRTELLSWPVPAGNWEWRLRLPTRGADNRGAGAWHQGRCELAPGARTAVELPAH